MAFINEENSLNSLIGAGSAIKGNVKINGSVRLDGDLDGDIELTGNLHIGKLCRLQGNITAKSVIIEGIVKGDITASENVMLLSTSVVLGNIKTRRIQADENVVLHGHCIALSKTEEFEESAAKWQNQQTMSQFAMNIKNKQNENQADNKNEESPASTEQPEVQEQVQENTEPENKEFIPVNLGEKISSSTRIFNSFNSRS